MRESLGESLPTIEREEETLSKVSTPSFRALQLYSQANQLFVEQNLGGPDRNQAAEALLREAIVEDPECASAYIVILQELDRRQLLEAESLG